jgi:hypothetical protein
MSRQRDQIKDGRPPFIMIEEAVLRNHTLTAYEIAAYVTLVMHANHKGGEKAFPSHKTIGIIGGMSARQAKRAVDALAAKKLISIEADHDEKTGAQTSNIYTILPVTTPRLSVMGGLSDSQGAPDSQSYKPDESNQRKKKNAASAAQAAEQPSKVRPIFDAIALGSWGIKDSSGVNGNGGRIGKLEAWVKKTYPGATEKTIAAFYKWWKNANPKANAPRDLDKFSDNFIAFHEATMAAKRREEAVIAHIEPERVVTEAEKAESLAIMRANNPFAKGKAS